MHAHLHLKELVTRCGGLCLRTESDLDLLNRFVQANEAEAFAQLVHRHAGSVWAVCRRILFSEADCEDAFQATFLALARQAATLHLRAPLACWLHTVAFRIARKAHVRSARRGRELPTDLPAKTDVGRDVSSRELLRVVDEEIERLPQPLRGPLLLCCLEGRTRDEAAEALGCSVAVVKSRLERARTLLRRNLQRRGIELPAAFLMLGIGASRVSAALEGKAVASALGWARPAVLALAAASWSNRVIVTAVSLVAACLFGLGLFGLAQGEPPPAAPKAAFDPQVPEVAVAQPDRKRMDEIGDPLPEAALLRLGTKRFRHPNSAHGLALSPDGKTVVTLGWEGLYAWDTATGKEMWRAEPKELQPDLNPAVGATRLVFCPDGKSCITLGPGTSFTLWNAATGKATTTAVAVERQNQPAFFSSLDLSPDGKILALGAPEGVYLCDLGGTALARIASKPGPIRNPNKDRLLSWQPFSYGRFAPSGKTLAVVTSEAPEVIKICSTDGSEVSRLQLSARYLDSAFSPDGRVLAVAERDDTVRVYEIGTGKCLHSWPVPIRGANENYIFQILFAPDGKSVVASSSDKLIRIWDVASGAEAGQLKGHAWYPWGLAFSADSKTLYSTGWDGDIRRWDLATRKQLPLPFGTRGSAVVAAAPDGRTVVYVDGDRNLRFVSTKDGRESRKLNVPDLAISQLAFAPDGRSLALGGSSGDNVAVGVLDVSSGQVTRRWDWPKGKDPHASVEGLAFTRDGRRLAAIMFRQGQARVWDLSGKGEPLVLAHSTGYGLSFSPDGQTLITAGWDKKLRFWDPTSGELKRQFLVAPPTQSVPGVPEPNDTRLWGAAFSPDGTRIAAADLNELLWMWDAVSLQVKFVVHTGDIFRYNCMAFSADGQWLATGGATGKVKVWDATTGHLVWDRGAHAGDLYTVSFSRDSRRLLSGGRDGLGYLWDLRPKDLPVKKAGELWDDLLAHDGPTAYRAFWALLEQPAAAVHLLAERGDQLLAKVNADRVQAWIGALDDASFAKREAARQELTRHLAAATPLIRKELARTSSLEQQRRLQRLLEQGEHLSSRFGLVAALLAHLDTPAARRLLAHWAEVDPAGPLGGAAARLMP
jgi:RNA polymerase sigma factor (sigma-70 family)